jgi:putative exosortase-associated protein (TIGR04073 family)
MRAIKKAIFATAMVALLQPTFAAADTCYLEAVEHKLERGFTNLFTGLAEVPKNILVNSKQTDYVTGSTGGIISGTVDTLGRTATGIWDVVTSPIPTQSLVQPEYIWNDFDKKSTFSLNTNPHQH